MTLTADVPVVTNIRFLTARALAAAAAAIVFIDAVSVRAPGLALLGVPFLIAALRYRHGTRWGSALVLAWCALYLYVGVAFAVGNGFDAGWGDLLFAYGGTPLAALLAVALVRGIRSHRPETE